MQKLRCAKTEFLQRNETQRNARQACTQKKVTKSLNKTERCQVGLVTRFWYPV